MPDDYDRDYVNLWIEPTKKTAGNTTSPKKANSNTSHNSSAKPLNEKSPETKTPHPNYPKT